MIVAILGNNTYFVCGHLWCHGSKQMNVDRDFSERQAECATVLVAIAQLLLNSPPNEFACWLRMIADEIDAKGVEEGLGLTLADNDDE